MMSTVIGIIVMGTEIGIGPPIMGIAGTEEGVQTGGARRVVGTGRIMLEEEHHPITEVMNGTGNDKGTGTGTVIADDHCRQKDPIEKITRELEADPLAKTERGLGGKRTGSDGQKTAERRVIHPSKTKSRRRLLLKRMRKTTRTC